MMRIALTPWNPWFREPTLQKQHNRTPCQGRLVHPFGDAGLLAAQSADTPLLNNTQIPPGVRTILIEKCAGLPLQSGSRAFLSPLCPGLVAHGARYCRGQESDESFAVGYLLGGPATDTGGGNGAAGKIARDASHAVSNDSLERANRRRRCKNIQRVGTRGANHAGNRHGCRSR
jgi:hypothetical protein